MSSPKKISSEKASQHAKFIDAAKAAETDDDPEAFKERLKNLVTAPIPKPVSERKGKKK